MLASVRQLAQAKPTAVGAVESRAMLAKRFFAFLHEKGVTYCVVGDTRHLPARVDSDIDLVVDPELLDTFPLCLGEFCARNDLRLVQCFQHEATAFYYVVSWIDDCGVVQFLQIDVCGDYYRAGCPFLTAYELLVGRVEAEDERGRKKGFFVPASSRAFLYYLLKRIDKQSLDDRQGEYLTVEWRGDPVGSRAAIARYWSDSDASLLSVAADSGRWDRVRSELPRLREALRRLLGRDRRSQWPELTRRVGRMLRPTGLLVAVMGPDGSGKSTVIDAITSGLAPAFRRTAYFHLRPRLGARNAAAGPVIDPHGDPPRGTLASATKAVYYALDYLAGYACVVRPRLVRSTLVVFDRYAYDLAVDPLRYRFGRSSPLTRLAGSLAPRPNVLIVLDAPVAVLRARKQEVTTAELARAREAYRSLAQSVPNAHVVDASLPLLDVVTQVQRIVLDCMSDRARRRLGIPSPWQARRTPEERQ